MVTSKLLLTAILVSSVILLSKSCVDGFRQSCPMAAIVNLTGEKPDSSGSVVKSGEVFPGNAVWFDNGRTFGCPCTFKTCVSICCPAGNSINADDCVEDLNAFGVLLAEKYNDRDFHLFVNEPCSRHDPLMEKYHEISRDELVHLKSVQPKDGFAGYCQGREDQSAETLVEVICIAKKSDGLMAWFLGCVNLSMLFALATFIVYAVIPELKSLHGSMLRCYLASYIAGSLLFTGFLLQAKSLISYNFRITLFFGSGVYYFCLACMMWLNVMSFDIWQKFRSLRSSWDIDIKERERAKFFRYSIYAWGGATVPISMIIICSVCNLIGSLPRRQDTVMNYLIPSPIVGIALGNSCLFISTALTIRRLKKDTVRLVDGMNKHHRENEQWFNLYIKLLVLMGGPLIFWAVAFYWGNEIFHVIVFTLEALQGVSIFFTFIWKDDVKRLLRKRFVGMRLRTLGFFFHRGAAPAVEI